MIEQVKAMSTDERFLLEAYLTHMRRADDPTFQVELSQSLDEMNAGQKHSLEKVKRLHQALAAEGL